MALSNNKSSHDGTNSRLSESFLIDWSAQGQEAAQLLSQYIQFDTTNPPGNEAPAIEFLATTLRQRGFTPQIVTSAPTRANLIVRLPASGSPQAPPCLLYAHADVVPADAAAWSVDPFGGQIKDGYVWGRGALDDKGLGIIFIQVLTLLKRTAPALKRDIILLIAADEETCGSYGVAWLLKHHPDLIKAEFVWDEGGMALPDTHYNTLYHIAVAEKSPLTLHLVAQGKAGHAAMTRPNNPLERLNTALYRLKKWQRPAKLTLTAREMLRTVASSQPFPQNYLFRHADKPFLWPFLRASLDDNPMYSSLINNTISLTKFNGGQASNVVPDRATATLDVRLLPDEDPIAFITSLRSMIGDPGITVEVETWPPQQKISPIDTEFYRALVNTLQTIGPPGMVTPFLTPGATDSRFFRSAGMKAYGFMPMLLDNHELSRVHSHDERVSIANLSWGIQTVFETLRKL